MKQKMLAVLEYERMELLKQIDDIIEREAALPLKQYLDFGLNNSEIQMTVNGDLHFGRFYKTFDGEYLYDDEKMTKKQLKVLITIESIYTDNDGYTCACINFANEEDEQFFQKTN